MSKHLVLDIATMQEDFFADTVLIGVVSALPAYRFCWLLNLRLNTNFVREPDMDITLKRPKGDIQYFPLYQYCLPLNGCKYLLYKLRNGTDSLVPELKQLDYLWMIRSKTAEGEAAHIMQQLKLLPDVQLAQYINGSKLKHIGNLLI